MSKITKLAKVIGAIAVLMGTAAGAHAAASYGNLATPGVYFGSGNTNGNFTIDTSAGGIEVGLRAKNYKGSQIVAQNGVYHSSPGLSSLGPRAVWNYEFSMNSGADALSIYYFQLGVDNDASAGKNFTYVDAANFFVDNATMSGATFHSSQNSENFIFGNTPGGPMNIFSAGLYSFTLSAFARGANGNPIGSALASTEILVAVPEPESMAMMGVGMLGLMLARRRRRAK